ncbi:MAG: glycosyltransferase [Planctomycetia bacterium]|nr:glycosyltransferase [Planctomycetia bacterium]
MTSKTNSSEHEPKLKVAYILKMFPRLSETFILNEILELERQNVGVDVFSLMPPGDGRFHGSLSELKLTIDFILREKPESYWDKLSKFSPGVVPHMDRWQNAANFLKEHAIPKDLDMLLRALFIGAKAKEKGIQHLHAHFATVSTRMAALVNILYDIPFSFTCHAKDIFRETVNRNLFRDLVDRSAFAITVSDFNRDYIIEKTSGVDATKIHRLYNGINLDFFEVPKDRSPLKASPIKLISVGRLVPKRASMYFSRLFESSLTKDLIWNSTSLATVKNKKNCKIWPITSNSMGMSISWGLSLLKRSEEFVRNPQ